MWSKARSTCADRLASPTACACHVKPKRSAKLAISGTGTMAGPVPDSTTTCVLSVMHLWHAPPKYTKASVRKTLHSKRVKRGYICMKIIREWHRTSEAVWTDRFAPSRIASCGDVSCCISSPGSKTYRPDGRSGSWPMWWRRQKAVKAG